MAQRITGKKFAANAAISIAVQVLSLAVSLLISLVVPKFIDKTQYAHFQTYILYMSYVGILHFGLLDGIVLRYSQYDYEELDKARMRSQFRILFAFTVVLAALVSAFALLFCEGTTRQVIILIAVSIVSKNAVTYTSYMFQITNKIKKYAALIMTQRGSYGVLAVVLLCLGVQQFYWYCLAELAGDFICMTIACVSDKELFFGKPIPLKEGWKEVKTNISSGFMLLIANWTALLLIGGAKMIVQWHWDDYTFSDVSLAFSVANLFLAFVSAVSIVLFPSLKRVEETALPEIYQKTRPALSMILLFVLILYFPGRYILAKWLPNYADSLTYLGILLPLIVFSSKVNLLNNNYLKVYRKEKTMFYINVVSAAIGILLFLFCAYALNNLNALLVSVVFIIMLNAAASERAVCKTIQCGFVKEFIMEAMMAAAFIFSVKAFSLWMGCAVYALAFAVYCVLHYKTIGALISVIFRRGKEKNRPC